MVNIPLPVVFILGYIALAIIVDLIVKRVQWELGKRRIQRNWDEAERRYERRTFL